MSVTLYYFQLPRLPTHPFLFINSDLTVSYVSGIWRVVHYNLSTNNLPPVRFLFRPSLDGYIRLDLIP